VRGGDPARPEQLRLADCEQLPERRGSCACFEQCFDSCSKCVEIAAMSVEMCESFSVAGRWVLLW
jgi:hypothetical protein